MRCSACVTASGLTEYEAITAFFPRAWLSGIERGKTDDHRATGSVQDALASGARADREMLAAAG